MWQRHVSDSHPKPKAAHSHLNHKKFRAASSFFNKVGTKYDSFYCLAKGGLALHPDSLHHSRTPSTPQLLTDSVAVTRLFRPRISPIRFLAGGLGRLRLRSP